MLTQRLNTIRVVLPFIYAKNVSIRMSLYLIFFFTFKGHFKRKFILFIIDKAENEIIRNEFNSYPSYTIITWVGTGYAFL